MNPCLTQPTPSEWTVRDYKVFGGRKGDVRICTLAPSARGLSAERDEPMQANARLIVGARQLLINLVYSATGYCPLSEAAVPLSQHELVHQACDLLGYEETPDKIHGLTLWPSDPPGAG